MKNFFARRIATRYASFTLVELLVVIGIIAILAAVLLGVFGNVINMAKRAKAQNTATQIQTATLSYYTEYSVYPTPSGTLTGDYFLKDDDTGTGNSAGSNDWGPLIECLSGMVSPAVGGTSTETVFSNTRQIAFITLKSTDVGNTTAGTGDTDAPLNPLPPASGNKYFNIVVDAGYSGLLGSGDTSNGSQNWLPGFTTTVPTAGAGSSTAGVAVWANCNFKSNMTNSAWYVHTY
jgi:prepilin-type N-terminal cleavage/methylation domain-containing protein